MRAIMVVAVLTLAGCGGTESPDPITEPWRGNEVTFGLKSSGTSVPYCSGETSWGGSLNPDSTWYDCQWLCGYYQDTSRTYVHVTFTRDPAGAPGYGWTVRQVYTESDLARCP